MKTTYSQQIGNGFFVLCMLCLVLSFLIGCGGGTPELLPVEKAEVDLYVTNNGRAAIACYLQDQLDDGASGLDWHIRGTSEQYIEYFISQGADANGLQSRSKLH